MDQMRGEIKCSCLRSWARLEVPVYVSHVWPLCCFEALLNSLKVFIGMPRVHLWVTQAMTATSMYSQAQGSSLNNSTSYVQPNSKTQSVWMLGLRELLVSALLLRKCTATKYCDVTVTFAALMVFLFHLWTDTSDIHWPQWCSDQLPFKRDKVFWK